MKKLLFIILIGSQPVFAQQELERANTYFERAFYSDAIPLYEQVLSTNKSQHVLQNLADAYYRTYDMHSAARWYKTLTSRTGKTVDPEYFFKLNQSLKATGKYEEAENALQKYYQNLGDSVSIDKARKDNQYLNAVNAIGDRFIIQNLPLNTPGSEFAAIQIDSNLIYTAASKRNTSLKKRYRWNNQNYLDIYAHPIVKINQHDAFSKSLPGKINTKMHEGTYAITKDRKTIYFTRNNYLRGRKKTDEKKVSNLKIYKAEWIDNRWDNITELPFNSDKYSTEHPALTEDETKLYFASDRPGGFGSFDLYSVNILSKDTYSSPVNLGASINTPRKEQFPFLDEQNNLYFASNGHPGFGLLDIFISKLEFGDYKKPDNLGLPVNSGYDDFAISFHSSKEGYFSSNRPTGKGSDDIYSFRETKPLVIKTEEETTQLASNIPDKTDEGTAPSNEKEDEAIVRKDDKTFIKTEQIHFDYNLWYLRKDVRNRLDIVIRTMNKYPIMKVEVGTHTDNRGNDRYNLELSQKRADSVKEFLVENGISEDRVIAVGYGESKPLVQCPAENDCTEQDHEQNRRCEFIILEWK
ncbi:OmpA family protein [Muricauda sp. HICW]|uniref:OmpA family protein n=1 Tax=Flagellimonas chongwuensis TaxID=2697365 RepID=A0A850NBJ9_9FLAO|nr:OmpA family protein [Allomuricauda chongwuensis]NVN18043.1 OmpA family protein [Allomuricauda chongwuensis]